jgi:transposase
MRTHRRLHDAYRFAGFRPTATVRGIFGDPKARVLRLTRRGKTVCGTCGTACRAFYEHTRRQVRDLSCGDTRVHLELPVGRVRCQRCGTVKRESLALLSDTPFYTKRFAFAVDRRLRVLSGHDSALPGVMIT